MGKLNKNLIIGLLIMACLTPAGIYLPKLFHSDGAWGEWSVETVGKHVGFIPSGMKNNAEKWKAPIADYGDKGEGQSPVSKMITYVLSGFTGLAIISLVTIVLFNFTIKHD
jgi:hypothetical protein